MYPFDLKKSKIDSVSRMTPPTCIGSPMCVELDSGQTPSNQSSTQIQGVSRPTQNGYFHNRVRQIRQSSNDRTHATCRRLFDDDGDDEVDSLNLESLALNG